TAIASAYFLWCAYDPFQWHLIDGVNLVIHEAGHIVFRPFGEFMMIAGGSLFQVIMPALFVGYFCYQRQFYSAALVLFWVGESILNVSVYAETRSEEHTSELQSRRELVCRLLLEKKKTLNRDAHVVR